MLLLWLACTDEPPPQSGGQPPPEGVVRPCYAAPPTLEGSPVSGRAQPPLVTANGATSVAVSMSGVVDTWTDHAEHEPAPGVAARDRLEATVFGARVDGAPAWLDTIDPDTIGYEPGTGIIAVEQELGGVTLVTRTVAPIQDGAGPDLLVVVEARNDGGSPATVQLWVTTDAHPGGAGIADAEAVAGGPEGILEARVDDLVVHRPLPPAAHFLASPADPRPLLAATVPLPDQLADGDDVRVTFSWPEVVLPPGGRTVAALALSTDDGAWLDGADPDALLSAERQAWDAWHAEDVLPAGLDDDEDAIARQATATLRMAILRDGPAAGGLLAALGPGGRNQLFTRDAAFGAVALARTGHLPAARDAFDALLASDSGAFASELGLDGYGVPLSHAEGDGTEASDPAECPGGGDAGIDASLDTLGWALWAFAELADADPAWGDQVGPTVRDQVLEPLVALVDTQTGRLPADGGFWGRHWVDCPPEGRQVHSTSAVAAIVGIRASAERLSRPEHLGAADLLLRGLLDPTDAGGPLRLDERGEDEVCPVLLTSPDEACDDCDPLDAMVAELVGREIVDPTGALARATVAELLAGLRVGAGPGVRANDDADAPEAPDRWEDLRESVPADLRLAVALAAMGEEASARVLVDRVTAAARANHDRIPEALSDGVVQPQDGPDGVDDGGQAQGAVPLVGLGAGAWLLALDALQGR